MQPIFVQNGVVGEPASGGLGGSAAPNGTNLPPKPLTQQSISGGERLLLVDNGQGSFN
jgi:hypothetical protein